MIRVLVGLGGRAERPATETLGDEFGDPQPICLSTGFRDKAVNLEARVWIDDPPKWYRFGKER
jgi:hypothetical protein